MFRKVPRQGTKVPSPRALWCPAEEHIERWWMGLWKYRGKRGGENRIAISTSHLTTYHLIYYRLEG